jgi:hypothetical protein
MVWSSLFETAGCYDLPADGRERLGLTGLALPEWTGVNHGLWEDLAVLRSHLQHVPPYWLVAVTVLSARRIGGPVGPHFAETNPAEIDPDWTFLGWDVADGSRLSALSNCGWPSGVPHYQTARWARSLNDRHLFTAVPDAVAYRRKCEREIREHRPFFVYGLWHIGSSEVEHNGETEEDVA